MPYKTMEHRYQARKAKICKNEQAYHDIMCVRFPADAKCIGGRVTETTEWRQIKLDIMEELLYCKFKHYTISSSTPDPMISLNALSVSIGVQGANWDQSCLKNNHGRVKTTLVACLCECKQPL